MRYWTITIDTFIPSFASIEKHAHVIMTELSTLSPPVGFNLFVLQMMTGRDGMYVTRATMPFFFLLVVAVAILAVFPEIVTWLPKKVMAR